MRRSAMGIALGVSAVLVAIAASGARLVSDRFGSPAGAAVTASISVAPTHVTERKFGYVCMDKARQAHALWPQVTAIDIQAAQIREELSRLAADLRAQMARGGSLDPEIRRLRQDLAGAAAVAASCPIAEPGAGGDDSGAVQAHKDLSRRSKALADEARALIQKRIAADDAASATFGASLDAKYDPLILSLQLRKCAPAGLSAAVTRGVDDELARLSQEKSDAIDSQRRAMLDAQADYSATVTFQAQELLDSFSIELQSAPATIDADALPVTPSVAVSASVPSTSDVVSAVHAVGPAGENADTLRIAALTARETELARRRRVLVSAIEAEVRRTAARVGTSSGLARVTVGAASADPQASANGPVIDITDRVTHALAR